VSNPSSAVSRSILERLDRAVLRASLFTVPIVFIVDALVSATTGDSLITKPRIPYVLTMTITIWQLCRTKPNSTWLLIPTAGTVITLNVLENLKGMQVGGSDSVITLIVLFVIGLVLAIKAGDKWPWTIAGVVAFMAPWGAWSAVQDGVVTQDVVLRAGIPAVALGLMSWLTVGLIRQYQEAAEANARRARLQTALHTASRHFLTTINEDEAGRALSHVLHATGADSIFLTRKARPGFSPPTPIREHAIGAPYVSPDGMRWWKFQLAHDDLAKGLTHRFDARSLSGPEISQAAEWNLGSGLLAPIILEGAWEGTIGVASSSTDFVIDDAIELALQSMAELIRLFWNRQNEHKQIQENIASKDSLIAAVSHELRTPLTGILGFAEAMLEGPRTPQHEYLALIAEQGRDMTEIVEDLLTSARVESGGLAILNTKTQLRPLIDSVIKSSRIQSLTDSSVISVSGQETEAFCDPVRARQIVRNLISNALRYGGSLIEVRLNSEGESATIDVADNGPAVTGQVAARLFEPYFTRGTDRGPGAVGLGLSVSRQLARLMNGDVESMRVDGWTVFRFRLLADEPLDDRTLSGAQANR